MRDAQRLHPATLLRAVGVGNAQVLDRAKTAPRFPLFSQQAQGISLPHIGQIDGRALRSLLLDKIRSTGSDLMTGRAEIGQAPGDTATVTIDGPTSAADEVVVAAGDRP